MGSASTLQNNLRDSPEAARISTSSGVTFGASYGKITILCIIEEIVHFVMLNTKFERILKMTFTHIDNLPFKKKI